MLPGIIQAMFGGWPARTIKASSVGCGHGLLLIGAIVTSGRRTVSHILWTVRSLVDGHPSSYHRVFSKACWGLWPLAKVLACCVVALVPPGEPVMASNSSISHQPSCGCE